MSIVNNAYVHERTFDEGDVRSYAFLTGDTNELHLDSDYAEDTQFGERIVHGMLVAGTIGSALQQIEGTVVYLEQDLSFEAPVYVGDEVRAVVDVVEQLQENVYRVNTQVFNAKALVIDGEATIMVNDNG